MFVYIINKNGQPLMPCNPQKARKLLKADKAEVVKYEPFTIKLKYGSSGYKQPITLGIDTGSIHIGASASTEKHELYASETVMRSSNSNSKASIVSLLAKRLSLRRNRRSRKTRYRKARFLNRVHSKHKGWLAPSIENKIHVHLKLIADIHKILPITKVVVEVAQFDIQKIKKPSIHKKLIKVEKLGKYKNLTPKTINVMKKVLKKYGETLPIVNEKLSIESEENIDAILKAFGDYYKKGEISGKPYGTFAGKELQPTN